MDARAVPGSSSFFIFRLPLPPLFFSLLCPESRSVKKNVLPSEFILRKNETRERECVWCGHNDTMVLGGGGTRKKKGGSKKKRQRNEKKT